MKKCKNQWRKLIHRQIRNNANGNRRTMPFLQDRKIHRKDVIVNN